MIDNDWSLLIVVKGDICNNLLTGHATGTDSLEVPTRKKANFSGLCFREYTYWLIPFPQDDWNLPRKHGLTAWRVPLIKGLTTLIVSGQISSRPSPVRPKPGIVASKAGNHPKMAELFRLVNYYNLPRLFACCKWGYILICREYMDIGEGHITK